MKLGSYTKILLVCALVFNSFPNVNASANEVDDEIALPEKQIADFYVDGYRLVGRERIPYKGQLSAIKDHYDPRYGSIFTRFSQVKAQLNEDAGEGKIITKIEFLKGDEVVKTENNINKRKYESEVLLTPEKVEVVSRDNKSPSGATINFKLVGGTRWEMWESSSWKEETKSLKVTPKKFDNTNIDAYPGTFYTHFAEFNRMVPYKSVTYPGVFAFDEKWIDDKPTVLDELNGKGKVGDTVKVDPDRADIEFQYYGETVKGRTDPSTKALSLSITSLGSAGIFFTQYYDHSGYYKEGKQLMTYASAYIYTIKSYTYRYPDRIRIYTKTDPGGGGGGDDDDDHGGGVGECTIPQPSSTIDGKDLDPTVTAVIKADKRNAEQFNVLQGIPTSESLYGNVLSKRYLFQHKFVQMTGKCTFEVTVKKKFALKWDPTKPGTDSKGKPITLPDPQTDDEVVTKVYKVERPYSYWIIDNLEVYQIDKAKLLNYAFEGGKIEISPENYDSPIYSTGETHGYVSPDYDKVVNVAGPTRDGGISRPVVSGEEFPEEAEKVVGKMKVTNDTLTFEGSMIMNPVQSEVNGPTPEQIKPAKQIDKDVLYSPNNMIPISKVNKANQPSSGTIFYTIMAGNINGGENKEFPINGINPVTVHTPVVMYPNVSNDSAHNQKTKPAQNRQAVILERPFTVYLPNSGQHTNYQGYGNRNYEKYIRVKQVQFPFDVFVDESKSTFYPKDTWIDIQASKEAVQFYLPVWVNEGFYDVKFRSIAENAPEGASYQTNANLDLTHHIAYDTVPVDVIGRLYDFHITDIADHNWETVFRKEKGGAATTGTSYWVGTNRIDGASRGINSKYTLPIKPGSHPLYKNVVTKTGYHFKFDLKTKGNMFGDTDAIRITPTFNFQDNDPKTKANRIAVDLYYHSDNKKFIKIGSPEDKERREIVLNTRLRNVSNTDLVNTAGSIYDLNTGWSITRNQYVNSFITRSKQKTYVGGYDTQVIPSPLRTFINPFERPSNASASPSRVNASIQQWYGEYSLPANVYAVPKGTDLAAYGRKNKLDEKSKIFLKNGYIIVNFNIESIRNADLSQPYLQYIHAPLNNQWWNMEGYDNADGSRDHNVTDPYGVQFKLADGDVIFYDSNISSYDDYSPNGTH